MRRPIRVRFEIAATEPGNQVLLSNRQITSCEPAMNSAEIRPRSVHLAGVLLVRPWILNCQGPPGSCRASFRFNWSAGNCVMMTGHEPDTPQRILGPALRQHSSRAFSGRHDRYSKSSPLDRIGVRREVIRLSNLANRMHTRALVPHQTSVCGAGLMHPIYFAHQSTIFG